MSTVIIVTVPPPEEEGGRSAPSDKKVTVEYKPAEGADPAHVLREMARIKRLADKIVGGEPVGE